MHALPADCKLPLPQLEEVLPAKRCLELVRHGFAIVLQISQKLR